MAWTDERRAAALKLWDDGLSAAEIARRLGDGVSRCAVIGVVYRAGKSNRRPKTSRQAYAKAPKVARAPRAAAKRPPARPKLKLAGCGAVFEDAPARAPRVEIDRSAAFSPLPGSSPKPWLERRFGECAWPVGGEGADTLSCCQPAEGQYCRSHLALRASQDTRFLPSAAYQRTLRRFVA